MAVVISLLATPEDAEAERAIGNALGQAFGPQAVMPLAAMPQPQPRTTYVFVVVIGPTWAGAIQQPQNAYQRQTLGNLLRQSRLFLILPVLVGGAAIPPAVALPPDLHLLPQLQAMPVAVPPGFQRDIEAVVRRIRAFEQEVRRTLLDYGDFTNFKLFSFLPLAALAVLVILIAVFQVAEASEASIAQNALAFPFAALFFTCLIALWPTATILALRTRRYRWALINGLVPPLSLALAALDPLLAPLPDFWSTASAGVILITWIVAWILLPIIFGLTLPPHRRKSR